MSESKNTSSSGGSKKKSLVTRWELWMIIISVLIFLYILLKNAGVEFVQKNQEMELTDDPHPDGH